MSRRIRHYAEIARIQKPVSPHTIRHTFTTHLSNGAGRLRLSLKRWGISLWPKQPLCPCRF
ncbi:hypothetical protein [Desulfosporosinus shakirovi]|uniref:hypothetical protein n=1 Tax=Desulfosporosinus shakirovi TaxID=2885154 RepID=UPI0037C099A9